MEKSLKSFLENYGNILLLLLGITIGSIIGISMPSQVIYLKPIGDIFLNFLFVSIIPLIFFAISSAVANIEGEHKLGRILSIMAFVFVSGVAIAAAATIAMVWLFPVEAPKSIGEIQEVISQTNTDSWGDKIVRFVTVSEFGQLLSRQNMLAFIIFSFGVGIATRKAGKEGLLFLNFLNAGNAVMKNLLLLLMKASPIGLGAYFAYQVGTLGNQLFGFYAKPLALYYAFGTFYFFVFFSIYAFIAQGRKGIPNFWKNNILPSITALSTCSSLATLPTNLVAAQKIGVPAAIANVVIPLGNTLNKHGSSISSIVKIYVCFLIMDWDFFTVETIATAIGITILVSIVAGGIPNGGYIGEMLMISVYGLPAEAMPAVMIIGTLVDPLATVLNATGDTVAAMVVTRLSGEKIVPPPAESSIA